MRVFFAIEGAYLFIHDTLCPWCIDKQHTYSAAKRYNTIQNEWEICTVKTWTATLRYHSLYANPRVVMETGGA